MRSEATFAKEGAETMTVANIFYTPARPGIFFISFYILMTLAILKNYKQISRYMLMFLVFQPNARVSIKDPALTQAVIKSYLFHGFIMYLINPREIIFKKASIMKIRTIP